MLSRHLNMFRHLCYYVFDVCVRCEICTIVMYHFNVISSIGPLKITHSVWEALMGALQIIWKKYYWNVIIIIGNHLHHTHQHLGMQEHHSLAGVIHTLCPLHAVNIKSTRCFVSKDPVGSVNYIPNNLRNQIRHLRYFLSPIVQPMSILLTVFSLFEWAQTLV